MSEGWTKELYLFKGSQFVIKAVAALALKGMLPGDGSYVARQVPLAAKGRKKLLPAPHTVPVMKWQGDIIPGSDNLCLFLDQKFPDKPLLYPKDEAGKAAVRAMEERISTMYWANGYLSTCDGQEAFERWVGGVVHETVTDIPIVGSLAWNLAPKLIMSKAYQAAESGWRDTCRVKGGPFARYADIPTSQRQIVWDETQTELKALDAIVATSSTGYICNTPTPSAADLTLYGMLERWVGDSLFGGPAGFGPAQPTILDNTPALKGLWSKLRGQFAETCSFAKYGDLTAVKSFVGEATYAPWTSGTGPAPGVPSGCGQL